MHMGPQPVEIWGNHAMMVANVPAGTAIQIMVWGTAAHLAVNKQHVLKDFIVLPAPVPKAMWALSVPHAPSTMTAVVVSCVLILAMELVTVPLIAPVERGVLTKDSSVLPLSPDSFVNRLGGLG